MPITDGSMKGTDPEIRELDVVELAVDVGRWSAGTHATVLEMFGDGAVMVEIADERGHTLEMLSLPGAILRPVRVPGQGRLAV